MRVRSLLILAFTLNFIVFAALWPSRETYSEEFATDVPKEIRDLLGKGLTIYEIDQELVRLDEKEALLIVEIGEVTTQVEVQEKVVEAKRIQAGKVLRSYYKGKRDNLWLLILNADNFYEALQTYYYLSVIFKQEQRILESHASSYRELKQLLSKLEQDRETLQLIRREYIAQRNRLVALQEELDQQLAEREDREEVLDAIDALTHIWETKGLPVFKYYFAQLAKAIGKLPEEIIARGNMKLQKGRFVMTITDTELTEFFRNQYPEDFENFTFSFAENDFTAFGARDDIAMSIKGYYELDEEANIIYFHLTKLVYNGFELPDTTLRSLAEQFDLNFYPDLLDMPFKVNAQEVKIENGQLSISFVLGR